MVTNPDIVVPDKADIVDHLVRFVDSKVEQWCIEADLMDMCHNTYKQLLDMKVTSKLS